jgi:hypothetical protein
MNKVGLSQVFLQAFKFSSVNYDSTKTTTSQAIYSKAFHNVSGSRQARTRVIFPCILHLSSDNVKVLCDEYSPWFRSNIYINPPLSIIIFIFTIISAEAKWKSCQIGTPSEMWIPTFTLGRWERTRYGHRPYPHSQLTEPEV